ncbi:MAG: calcium-binding protein [Alphaproteobacteria bacterium]|nr:calcium-binding protein [Alphaproteobacteria bacterium]
MKNYLILFMLFSVDALAGDYYDNLTPAELAALQDPTTRNEDISNTVIDVDVEMMGDGNYLYEYTVTSPNTNLGEIAIFQVDVSCNYSPSESLGYPEMTSYSDDSWHLTLGKEHPDFPDSYPADVSSGNQATWSLMLNPNEAKAGYILISSQAPVDREYTLTPDMSLDGYDYRGIDEFTPNIPWTGDFITFGTTQGPFCPPYQCDHDGCLSEEEDLDQDDVRNEDDNCPTVSNPNQQDEDEDGVGDDCEDLPTNTAPVANDDSLTTNQNENLHIDLSDLLNNDTDPEDDNLALTDVISGTGGYIDLGEGNDLNFYPTTDFTGDATFIYEISDGYLTDTATVTINVVAVVTNTAPVAVDDSLDATENVAITFTASELISNDSDPESDTLTITSVTSGTGGTVVLTGVSIDFTPTTDFFGDATFTYEISDGELTDTATVVVAVAEVVAGQVITGTKRADNLTGTAGDDTIYGLKHYDTIHGGAGNDYIDGGNHNDTLYGEDGNDTILGGDYHDYIDGGAGNDTIHGGDDPGDDTIIGGTGNDTLNGGKGHDTYIFNAGDGQDTIIDLDQYTNTLELHSISKESLWFTRVNDDVIINILGTTDQITILNWYTAAPLSNNYKMQYIEAAGFHLTPTQAELLVDAMVTHAIPADTASIPVDVQTAQAANWISGTL